MKGALMTSSMVITDALATVRHIAELGSRYVRRNAPTSDPNNQAVMRHLRHRGAVVAPRAKMPHTPPGLTMDASSMTGPRGTDAASADDLPKPSPRRVSCPWYRHQFTTLVALLDRVDRWHLPPEPAGA
jgi:hypothetical protein